MGDIFRKGIEAYQKTMSGKPEEPQPSERKRSEGSPLEPLGNIGGLLKSANDTGKPTGFVKTEAGVPAAGSKYQRVAKFLILVGSDLAASILAELDAEQVEAITREIAGIRGIMPDEGEAILAEFRSLLSKPYGYSGSSVGGIETARRILYASLGPEKGEALLNRAVPDSKENLFGFVEDFAPEQIALLLKDEVPSVAALILARMPPNLSAASLAQFPPDRKLEVAKRIAHRAEISPEVLERVSQALKEKARHIGRPEETLEIDGMKALTAILKQGDYSFSDKIVGELEKQDPGVGKDLSEMLYTLDDVCKAIDRPLQEKLSVMGDRDIAILLKGKKQEFTEKILSCISSGRRASIREEGEILGPVPKRDCDVVTGEFLNWFRKEREQGNIILSDDEDVFV